MTTKTTTTTTRGNAPKWGKCPCTIVQGRIVQGCGSNFAKNEK